MTSHIDRQKQHFNSIADEYQRGRSEDTHIRIKELIWASALDGLDIDPQRTLTVLEPMCGFAEGLAILQDNLENDIDYRGFDYSDTIVASLREQGYAAEQVWHQDVTTYQPEPQSLDVIILIGGLHHVPREAESVVSRLSQGLKPGGCFINFEPTSGNRFFKMIRDQIYKRNEIFDQETERAFGVTELENIFVSAGLTPERVVYPGLLAYVLYYNPYAFPILNKGGTKLVDWAFRLDRLFMSNLVGRFLSFATLSIWSKSESSSD